VNGDKRSWSEVIPYLSKRLPSQFDFAFSAILHAAAKRFDFNSQFPRGFENRFLSRNVTAPSGRLKDDLKRLHSDFPRHSIPFFLYFFKGLAFHGKDRMWLPKRGKSFLIVGASEHHKCRR
jgi:hypothetical protein